MANRFCGNAKKILPYLGFSVITGFLAGILGTAFKLLAQEGVHLSAAAYDAVGQNMLWLPALIIGAAALGLLASLLVSLAPGCKGGGIPTAVAAVRGMTGFRWISGVLVLPVSAVVTFLGGLPLGTEGPCVQMGTAIGDGVVQCLGKKKHRPWRRYIMTGGASAGFSVATASPISAILFSVEELHKHFSPLLLCGVSVSVVTAQVTVQLLDVLGIESGPLFHLAELPPIPRKLLFAPLVMGLVCGLGSVLFTGLYHVLRKPLGAIQKKCSPKLLFPALFAATAAVGVFLPDVLGTGHGLVDKLFETHFAWYWLLLIFLVRGVFTVAVNTSGVTGGLFLPTLAFGALVSSLCADGMIALGWLEGQYYTLMVVLGVTAFLGATSRIPVTACVFAVEALAGIQNIPGIVIATTAAYILAELSGMEDFTDTVLHGKLKAIKKETVEVDFTLEETSFLLGKEPRDLLWPYGCIVVSVKPTHTEHELAPGDVLTVRCNNDPTIMEELKTFLGQ